MDKGAFKVLLAAGAICGVVCLAYLAYSRPGYFTSQTYLGGLLALEFLAVAVWFYRRAFFPLVIVTFLLAGMHVPLSSVWTMARWGVLAAGGMIGSVIVFKERRFSFGTFHIIALFSILAALMSSAVSRFTTVSSLKVLSLLLLFAYASSGVRLAVENRESRFFTGLVVGCEILVGVIAISHFLGMSVMGNPNSLGAVMGVVGAPLLLWASLVPQETFTRRRRLRSLRGCGIFDAYEPCSRQHSRRIPFVRHALSFAEKVQTTGTGHRRIRHRYCVLGHFPASCLHDCCFFVYYGCFVQG